MRRAVLVTVFVALAAVTLSPVVALAAVTVSPVVATTNHKLPLPPTTRNGTSTQTTATLVMKYFRDANCTRFNGTQFHAPMGKCLWDNSSGQHVKFADDDGHRMFTVRRFRDTACRVALQEKMDDHCDEWTHNGKFAFVCDISALTLQYDCTRHFDRPSCKRKLRLPRGDCVKWPLMIGGGSAKFFHFNPSPSAAVVRSACRDHGATIGGVITQSHGAARGEGGEGGGGG